MIHPFNTKQLIAILYVIGILATIMYNMYKDEDFQPVYLIYGCIWPLVLFVQVLILIFADHADIRRTKKIKRKPSYFDTFEGKQTHPDLEHKLKRGRKKTTERT